MDKLQWFKFSYADWRMGKIQRCPEDTQARFINICCLYWSKQCLLSYEDAEIEIDKEHIDILIKKKIVILCDGFVSISFLDEQFAEIEENTKDKSISGIIGNLKRWHPIIYKRYDNKEINLEDAIKLSKSIADQSHTDGNPIATQSQNIADKTREEENREEETRKEEFEIFWDLYDKKVGDKKACEKKFNKLTKANKEKIFYTLENFKKQFSDKQYQPHPSTYLNQERWNDEIITTKNNKNDTINELSRRIIEEQQEKLLNPRVNEINYSGNA